MYSITYYLAGGSVATENPTEYTIEETFTLVNPTKLGYTFAGWTGTGLSVATTTVTIAKGSTGNRSYTATWELNAPEITFAGTSYKSGAEVTKDYNGQTGYTLTAFSGLDTQSGYTVDWTGPANLQINTISKDIIIKDVSQSGKYTAQLKNGSGDVEKNGRDYHNHHPCRASAQLD